MVVFLNIIKWNPKNLISIPTMVTYSRNWIALVSVLQNY